MDDPAKLVLAVVAVLSLGLNLLQYYLNRARLKFRIGLGTETSENQIGTRKGAMISISNIGSKPTFFGGIKAVKNDGDHFYPVFSVSCGTKIEPNDSIFGLIPMGHFVGQNIKDVIICDGVGREYKIPNKFLNKAIREVGEEKKRLQSLGFSA